MITIVTNLATREELTYMLPPEEAVIGAYEQERKNWHTWDYKKPADHPAFTRGKKSVACGDWAALTNGAPINGI